MWIEHSLLVWRWHRPKSRWWWSMRWLEYMLCYTWSIRNHTEIIHFTKWKELRFCYYEIELKVGPYTEYERAHERDTLPFQHNCVCIKTYVFTHFFFQSFVPTIFWHLHWFHSRILFGKAAGQIEWPFHREKWHFSVRQHTNRKSGSDQKATTHVCMYEKKNIDNFVVLFLFGFAFLSFHFASFHKSVQALSVN